MGLSSTTLPAKRVVTGPPLTARLSGGCSLSDARGRSETGDGAEGLAGAEAGSGQAAGFEEADDPSALAGVGAQELEHAGVRSSWFAGQGPADQVGEVVVTDAHGVGVAEG